MAARLHLTQQRQTIYDIVKQATDHPTAADIMDTLRAQGHHFAYGTVYNSLRYLTEVGLIRELKLGDSSSRYDGYMEDHQHVVCKVCGRVDEVYAELPHSWIESVNQSTNYAIESHQVILTGICPDCLTARKKM